MTPDSPYYSMHDHLPKLYGESVLAGTEFVKPFGYTLAVIADGIEMVQDGWVVSVRLNEFGAISDVFAWARPVMRQTDSMHPDAWNDAWLDEKNSAIVLAFIAKLMDPNDPTGKPTILCGPAMKEVTIEEINESRRKNNLLP